MNTFSDNIEILLIPQKVEDDEDPAYEWAAPNGRLFNVRTLDNGYFVSEFIPSTTGQFMEGSKVISRTPLNEKIASLFANATPNSFYGSLPEEINPKQLVLSASGLCVGAIIYPDLKKAKQAMLNALKEDKWYQHFEPVKKDMAREQAEAMEHARASLAFWTDQLRGFNTKANGVPEIFAGMTTAFGPISKETRDSLLSFFNAPGPQTWGDVAHSIIYAGESAWQIWYLHDINAPKSKEPGSDWAVWPDPEDFVRSLGAEKARLIDITQEKIAAAKRTLESLSPRGPVSFGPQ